MDVEIPCGEPTPPEWLDEKGLARWHDTMSLLRTVPGLLTAIDRDELALYSQALADYLTAREEVAEKGLTILGGMGGTILNPAYRAMESAWARVSRHGSHFGMSPADRARLKVDPKPAKSKDADDERHFAAG